MCCRYFDVGYLLYGKGDEGVGFYGVCEGRIWVMNIGNDGKVFFFVLLGSGIWFGEIFLFDDLFCIYDSYCDVDIWVGIIFKIVFKCMLESYF